MEQRTREKNDLQDNIMKEGDELRKSLLDKLFNLNILLSATFLVLFQLDVKSFEIKILNILPFCTVILILLYNLYDLRILGKAYHQLENLNKVDISSLSKMKENNFYVILIAIILSLIEIGNLFFVFLK